MSEWPLVAENSRGIHAKKAGGGVHAMRDQIAVISGFCLIAQTFSALRCAEATAQVSGAPNAVGLATNPGGGIIAVRRAETGLFMLDALSSGIRSLLWAATFVLAIIILAVIVAPVSSAANMANWLNFVGWRVPANWLVAHAQAGVHLSLQPIFHLANTECTRNGCLYASNAFELNVSETALIAASGVVVCGALLWFVARLPRFVHALRSDWLDDHTHARHGRA